MLLFFEQIKFLTHLGKDLGAQTEQEHGGLDVDFPNPTDTAAQTFWRSTFRRRATQE